MKSYGFYRVAVNTVIWKVPFLVTVAIQEFSPRRGSWDKPLESESPNNLKQESPSLISTLSCIQQE